MRPWNMCMWWPRRRPGDCRLMIVDGRLKTNKNLFMPSLALVPGTLFREDLSSPCPLCPGESETQRSLRTSVISVLRLLRHRGHGELRLAAAPEAALC